MTPGSRPNRPGIRTGVVKDASRYGKPRPGRAGLGKVGRGGGQPRLKATGTQLDGSSVRSTEMPSAMVLVNVTVVLSPATVMFSICPNADGPSPWWWTATRSACGVLPCKVGSAKNAIQDADP